MTIQGNIRHGERPALRGVGRYPHSAGVDDPSGLPGGIRVARAGTVGRVAAKKKKINIFTHANSNLIAFKGTIKPLSVGAEVMLATKDALTPETLEKMNGDGFYFTVNSKGLKNKRFNMKDVRSRFKGTEALIALYACHSGLDGSFIQSLADSFQVTALGFLDVVGYFPHVSENPLSIDRKRVGIGVKSSATFVTDFHALDKQKAVRKSPKPISEE